MSIHCCSVSLFVIFHFCKKVIDQKITTLGEETTKFWNANSLWIIHKLQATPPNKYNTHFDCLLELPLQKLLTSLGQEGEKGHPRASLTTHQQKLANTHWKKMWLVDSRRPHSLHSMGPCRFLFFSCSANWILSLISCQMKILIFRGILVFHKHSNHY
jgi:hypothetical protein